MGRTPKSWFRSPWLWLVVGLVLIPAFVLISQPAFSIPAPDTASGNAIVAVAAVAEVGQPQSIAFEPGSNFDSKQTSQSETATQMVADTPSSDNCIACHTDEALLKELAEEPEEVHSEEASGEG